MLVSLVAMAVPLIVTGSAQAALAGANPLTTTSRPDLVSATITGASTAQFCFDKALFQVPSQSSLSLGGYRSDNFLTSVNPTILDTKNNKCVDATFPTSINDTGDLPQFTFGQAAEGAALIQSGTATLGNRADSVALTGSNTNNGTAGHTTAPDLTGVQVDNVNTGNTLDFIYDQNVQITSLDSTKFTGYRQDGTPFGPVSGVVAGGNVVKVTFAGSLTSGTGSPPVIGVSEAGAVASQNSGTTGRSVSTDDAAAVANSAGATTTLPDLQSATLATNGTFVDYQFDKPLAQQPLNNTFPSGPPAPTSGARAPTALGNFEVYASDSQFDNPSCVESQTSFQVTTTAPVPACAANPQLPNNVVRAFYSPTLGGLNSQNFYEYYVKAAVTPGAVQTPALRGNGYGEAPVGDNQGAKAQGFTTGPDAFRVTLNSTTNTAAVLFDQRVFGATPSSFVLLDANGTPVPGGVGQQAGPPASPGTTPSPYVITVSFSGVAVASARALEIKGPLPTPSGSAAALTGLQIGVTPPPTVPPDDVNVQQIVQPTGSAAANIHFVRVAVKKAHKTPKKHSRTKHHSKKHHGNKHH